MPRFTNLPHHHVVRKDYPGEGGRCLSSRLLLRWGALRRWICFTWPLMCMASLMAAWKIDFLCTTAEIHHSYIHMYTHTYIYIYIYVYIYICLYMQSLRQTGLYKLTATRHHLDHLKHRHEDTRLLMHLIYDLRVNHHHRVFRWPPLLNNDALVKITRRRGL